MIEHPYGVALVTGGSRGIGRAVSLRLAQSGFTVVVNYRSTEAAAAAVCDQIAAEGVGRAISIQADVSQLDEAKRLFGRVRDEFGRLDILVNNAGSTKDALFLMMDGEQWWSVLANNLAPVVNCSRLALPMMLRARHGKIINMASVSGIRGVQGQTAYSTAKAAIIGFSKALAREVSAYGINVNCVAPGLIDTDMATDLGSKIVDQKLAGIPLKRVGRPEEVAELIALLASDNASYIQGQVLVIDGGSSM